jgi:hypothetical protein
MPLFALGWYNACTMHSSERHFFDCGRLQCDEAGKLKRRSAGVQQAGAGLLPSLCGLSSNLQQVNMRGPIRLISRGAGCINVTSVPLARAPARQRQAARQCLHENGDDGRRRSILAIAALLPLIPAQAWAGDSEGTVSLVDQAQAENLSGYQRQVLEYNQRIQRQNNAPPDFPSFIRDKFDITVVADGFSVTPEGMWSHAARPFRSADWVPLTFDKAIGTARVPLGATKGYLCCVPINSQ